MKVKAKHDTGNTLFSHIIPAGIVFSQGLQLQVLLKITKFHLHKIVPGAGTIRHGHLYRWTENSFPIFLYLKPVEISKKCFNIT